jgi:hypothetical protein
MFPVGLLFSLNCYILLIVNGNDLRNMWFLSKSWHFFLILKILWNYYQEFIKANGGQPIRLFHILKYERKLKIYSYLFFARL